MEKNSISFGKRPRDPMIKRVWKDIWRDRRRYIMIFLMLVTVIGFVSGMYVANNSMPGIFPTRGQTCVSCTGR